MSHEQTLRKKYSNKVTPLLSNQCSKNEQRLSVAVSRNQRQSGKRLPSQEEINGSLRLISALLPECDLEVVLHELINKVRWCKQIVQTETDESNQFKNLQVEMEQNLTSNDQLKYEPNNPPSYSLQQSVPNVNYNNWPREIEQQWLRLFIECGSTMELKKQLQGKYPSLKELFVVSIIQRKLQKMLRQGIKTVRKHFQQMRKGKIVLNDAIVKKILRSPQQIQLRIDIAKYMADEHKSNTLLSKLHYLFLKIIEEND